jgi:flagellar hook protein FlgE
MIGSLYTAVSGLNASTSAMSVIGDNISNTNTTGFKSTRALFSNLLSKSLGGGNSATGVGGGVKLWSSIGSWTQGSLETTNSPTDLAINGNGMFIVQDENGTPFYTRAGAFTFDGDGNLVNPDGLVVQGYETSVNSQGEIVLGALSNITIPSANIAPKESSEISLHVNLDAGANDGETYYTTMTAYDSLGSPVDLTITFTFDQSAGNWAWTASPSSGTTADTGTIGFNSQGSLDAATIAAGNPSITISSLDSGADPLTLTWNILDDSGADNGSMTGFAGQSATTFQAQDGYAPGNLTNTSINSEGLISGLYSNGQLSPFFQIALADFPSYWGLTQTGNSLYQASFSSGQAVVGTSGTGRLGNISNNSLEMSNVDLASEFVKMITTQRAFSANAKVISTSDEILAELINIKR